MNPYDGSLTGAVLLVHAATRDGIPTISDVSGSAEGLRISLASTTALVTLDALGHVAGVNIPATFAEGRPIPRPVAAREIDSTLMVASTR